MPPILVIVSGAVPVLVTVTVCDALVVLMVWFPKITDVGDRLTAEAVPVPPKVTVADVAGGATLMFRVAAFTPVVVGAKAMLAVQLAPAARLAPQVVPEVNWDRSTPPNWIPLKVIATPPVFWMVTVWPAPVVLIAWLPNARVIGVTE
jgi:hypothetical protein